MISDCRHAHLASENEVLCPTCGLNCSHIVDVYTLEGVSQTEGKVAYRGTRIAGSTESRRAALIVEFEGECGHTFFFTIQQHKGINCWGWETLSKLPPPFQQTGPEVVPA